MSEKQQRYVHNLYKVHNIAKVERIERNEQRRFTKGTTPHPPLTPF